MSTGWITDERMLDHFCIWDPTHIEVPDRLRVVIDKVTESGLLEQCKLLKSREADISELLTVHDKEYIDKIKSTRDLTVEQQEVFSSTFEDIYVNEKTWDCALLSAGSALELTKSVIDKEVDNGFAAIRPPGHHAWRDQACGFCIFNNVALCAKYARSRGLKRVLIVDFDVHAGQGTQYTVKDDEGIKLVSIHRYEEGNFWPNLEESNSNHDFHNTTNIPLNKTGYGDSTYLSIFQTVVLPFISKWDPEFILMSCGFDCAIGDPEGEMEVSPWGIEYMVGLLAAQKVPLVCLLEGGYFIPSVGECAVHTMKALINKSPPNVIIPSKDCFIDSNLEYLDSQGLLTILNRIRVLRNKLQLEYTPTKYTGTRYFSIPFETRDLYKKRSEVVEQGYLNALKGSIFNVKEKEDTVIITKTSNGITLSIDSTVEDLRIHTLVELEFVYFMLLLPLSLQCNVKVEGNDLPLKPRDFFGLFNVKANEKESSNELIHDLAKLPVNLFD